MASLDWTDPLPNGKQYLHGNLGAYATAKCCFEAVANGPTITGVTASTSAQGAPSGIGHRPAGAIPPRM